METPPTTPTSESKQLPDSELDSIRKELELKMKEYELKLKEPAKNFFQLGPTQATILVAVLGIFSTLVGIFLQGISNRKLETQKFESELILKVATSDNIDQNKKNLKFFVQAGLLKYNEEKILSILKDSIFELKIQQLPQNPVVKEKKDSVTVRFIDILTDYQKQLGKFEIILNKISNDGIDNAGLLENLSTIITDYNVALETLSDTVRMGFAFQTYWSNPEVSSKYLNCVDYARREIHFGIVSSLNNDIISPLNEYTHADSPAGRSDLKAGIKNKTNLALQQLHSKLPIFNSLINQVLPLL